MPTKEEPNIPTENYPVTWSGVDHSGANLRGADLSKAYLAFSNMRGTYLEDVNLRGADLRGADFYGAYLSGADLRGADLRGADLSIVNLSGADLSGAKIAEGTILAWAVGEAGGFNWHALRVGDGVILHYGCDRATLGEWRSRGPEYGKRYGYSEAHWEIGPAFAIVAAEALLKAEALGADVRSTRKSKEGENEPSRGKTNPQIERVRQEQLARLEKESPRLAEEREIQKLEEEIADFERKAKLKVLRAKLAQLQASVGEGSK